MLKIRHSFRESRQYSKVYLTAIAQEFAELYVAKFIDKNIICVEFGKRDTRGAPSITLIDDRHCVPHQRHFSTNNKRLAFMQGFITAQDNGRL